MLSWLPRFKASFIFPFAFAICLTLAISEYAFRREPAPPRIATPEAIELGPQAFGSSATAFFSVANRGGSPLRIDKIATSCSCAGIETELNGIYQRVSGARISPGESLPLRMKIAVNGRPGSEQKVHVQISSDDPSEPVRHFTARISQITGRAFVVPHACVFGVINFPQLQSRYLRIYDNGDPDRRVSGVKVSHPERFEAKLLPVDSPAFQPVRLESAGNLIAVIEVRNKSDWAGKFDGFIEILYATGSGDPTRFDVIGEVLAPIAVRPDRFVLPRRVGDRQNYGGEFEIVNRSGKPITAEAADIIPGVTVRCEPSSENPARILVAFSVDPSKFRAGLPKLTNADYTLRLRIRSPGEKDQLSNITITFAGDRE